MNERIKELAEQAGFDKHHAEHDTRIKQLIDLVRQDEREQLQALKPVGWLDDDGKFSYFKNSDIDQPLYARSKHD
jgi:hypothetical protein